MRHLTCFVTLAEELHFGRAARRLHMAQPALSQLVKRIERELDAQLFERTQRRVALTAAGEVLLPEARRLLRDADRITDEVRAVDRGDAGSVAIGFVGSAADDFLPRLVAEHRARHPRVGIRLEEGTTAQQIEWLRDERIGLGLGRTPIDDGGIATTVVCREPITLAVAETHRLADAGAVSLTEVTDERFILFPRHLGAGLHDHIHNACAAAGFTPRIAYEAVRMQTIVGLVSGGLGVALVPGSVRNLGRTGVRYVNLVDAVPAIELSLMWRSDDRSAHLASLRATAAAMTEPTSATPASTP